MLFNVWYFINMYEPSSKSYDTETSPQEIIHKARLIIEDLGIEEGVSMRTLGLAFHAIAGNPSHDIAALSTLLDAMDLVSDEEDKLDSRYIETTELPYHQLWRLLRSANLYTSLLQTLKANTTSQINPIRKRVVNIAESTLAAFSDIAQRQPVPLAPPELPTGIHDLSVIASHLAQKITSLSNTNLEQYTEQLKIAAARLSSFAINVTKRK